MSNYDDVDDMAEAYGRDLVYGGKPEEKGLPLSWLVVIKGLRHKGWTVLAPEDSLETALKNAMAATTALELAEKILDIRTRQGPTTKRERREMVYTLMRLLEAEFGSQVAGKGGYDTRR